MATHELKTHPQHFADVQSGAKRVEVRKDDRAFAVGDRLVLREWAPSTGEYTGRFVEARITHVLRGFEGLAPGRAGLSIELLQPTPAPSASVRDQEIARAVAAEREAFRAEVERRRSTESAACGDASTHGFVAGFVERELRWLLAWLDARSKGGAK